MKKDTSKEQNNQIEIVHKLSKKLKYLEGGVLHKKSNN